MQPFVDLSAASRPCSCSCRSRDDGAAVDASTRRRPPCCSSSSCSSRSRSSRPTRRSAAARISCSSCCSRSRCCAARSSARSRASAPACCSTRRTSALLGFTSLLLTLAGFWIGRYGETTARDRFHAPFPSVAVVTVLYALGSIVLGFVLGESAPAAAVLAGLPATRAAEPDPHLAGLLVRAPAASRRPSCPTASTRCGSLAEPRRVAALPARPTRGSRSPTA